MQTAALLDSATLLPTIDGSATLLRQIADAAREERALCEAERALSRSG